MSTSQPAQRTHKKGAGFARPSVRFALLGVAALALAASAYAAWFRGASGQPAAATIQAQRGPLLISVSESGTIENQGRAVVKSEVEGVATILYLVPEGTTVKKDDLLVELDASRLHDDKAQQQITVQNAEAAFIRARENLAVTRSQADSDVAKADLAAKFAEQDLKKYEEGEYPREIQKAEADINLAKETLQRATDKLDWSKRLADEGYVTRTELQADELEAKRAQVDLDLAHSALDLLRQYTHQRNLDQLKSDLEQAGEALDRTRRKGAADVVQAEAELRARQSEFDRQKAKLQKMDDQIAKCRMVAPVGGMVVYSTTGQGGRWRNVAPLDEGQQVRERQELIYLPTDAAMMVEVKIQEASLRKISVGIPARVTVDALPGRVFPGRVSKIALLPDAQSAWMNPDLKVYATTVQIEGDAGALRAGMTCRAEIIVEQYTDALFIPVQSVVRVGGQTVVYVPGPKGPEPREVKTGLDNNRMIRIAGGLNAGDEVLLAPPLAASVMSAEPTEPGTEPAARPPRDPASQALALATSAPAQATSAPAEADPPAIDPAKLRNMSPEERRRFFDSLTPEQRDALRKRMGAADRPRQRNTEERP